MNLEIRKMGNLHIIYDSGENITYSFEDSDDLLQWLTKAFENEELEEFLTTQEKIHEENLKQQARQEALKAFKKKKET